MILFIEWGICVNQKELVRSLIAAIGDDPNRPGVLDTPKRVQKSWERLFEGYKIDYRTIFTTFADDDDCVPKTGLVYLKNIEFYSFCEHHMLPFFGVAHVGYIPNGRVIGVSKLARLVDVFARRLQIQERIAEQVTTALMEELQPKGAACIIEARHMCMMARGVEKQQSSMGYSSMKGVFLTDMNARTEFINLVKG